MGRFIHKKKEQIGQSPGTLYFSGEVKMDEPQLEIIDFNSQFINDLELHNVEDIVKYKTSPSTTWLNINGLHDKTFMQETGKFLDLDNLVLEDIMNVRRRPKVEEQELHLFVSIKMLRIDEDSSQIISEQLSLIIAEKILITFQEIKGDVFNPVRERLKKNRKRIRNSGPDYLAYALLDIVIDNYSYIVSLFGEKIEALEDELLENPSQIHVERINEFKREINFLRKSIKPAKEMLISLSKIESDFIAPGTKKFIKELEHSIHQASDATDIYRDILSDQLNIYHSTVSSKLNDIMKVLTIFSAIFIPMTFLAGVYGTNFENIPELKFKYGYYILWFIMISVGGAMLLFFKRKKWL